jgi:hypothetical protein
MSIETGPCQIILKTDLPLLLTKNLIPDKFKYTIGYVLKNAIIGEKFVG